MSDLITEATRKVASFIDKKIYTKSDSGCGYGADDLNVGNITSTGLNVDAVNRKNDITITDYNLNDEGEVVSTEVISLRQLKVELDTLRKELNKNE